MKKEISVASDRNGQPVQGGLKRSLGLPDAVAIGLGAIIGAGIFVVTGVAAGVAGPAFLVGLLLTGIAAACNALSSAQLAAAYPQSEGAYEYGYRALHPWLGFAAGWMFLASKPAADRTGAPGFAGYLGHLIPGVPAQPSAAAAVLLLTGLNYFGIKKAGLLNTVIVALTLFALAVFIIAGIPAFRTDHLRPFAPNGIRGILEAAALLFFAYTGYACIATLGEEEAEPRHTIPKAIIISLGIAAILYPGAALVAVGSTGAEAMAASRSPLERTAEASAGRESPGSWGGRGNRHAGHAAEPDPRYQPHDLRHGKARRPASRAGPCHPVHPVPDWGLLLTGGAIALLGLSGTLQWIAAAASFTILLYYSIANLAALRMNPGDKLFPDWIPRLGLAMCLLLALSLRPVTILSGLILLAAGLVWRWAFRRRHDRAQAGSSD